MRSCVIKYCFTVVSEYGGLITKKWDGAEAARWDHNPEVDRSKLSPIKYKLTK